MGTVMMGWINKLSFILCIIYWSHSSTNYARWRPYDNVEWWVIAPAHITWDTQLSTLALCGCQRANANRQVGRTVTDLLVARILRT